MSKQLTPSEISFYSTSDSIKKEVTYISSSSKSNTASNRQSINLDVASQAKSSLKGQSNLKTQSNEITAKKQVGQYLSEGTIRQIETDLADAQFQREVQKENTRRQYYETERQRYIDEDWAQAEIEAQTVINKINERQTAESIRANVEARRLAKYQENEKVKQKYLDNPLLLNQTLSNLIDSGADAQGNLFEVTILAGSNNSEFSDTDTDAIQKNLTFRISNFNAPAKQLQTQDITYQAATYKKVIPSSNLTRQLDFNIRLDYNYYIYWYLHKLFAGDSFGNFDLNLLKKNLSNYLCTIRVKALRSKQAQIGYTPTVDEVASWNTAYLTSPAQFDIAYSWTFFDCYLIQIPQVAFGYDQTGALTPTFSFIFGMMAEGIGETGIVDAFDTHSKTNVFSLLTRDSKFNLTKNSESSQE